MNNLNLHSQQLNRLSGGFSFCFDEGRDNEWGTTTQRLVSDIYQSLRRRKNPTALFFFMVDSLPNIFILNTVKTKYGTVE